MRGTPEERFWAKVDKREPDDCWEWQMGKVCGGYGSFQTGTMSSPRAMRAHRFSWALAHGKIPEGMCILHKCDNPPCVNPNHLWIGSRADNNADKARKGRTARGTHVSSSKLTEEQVREIRALYASGKCTEQFLGDMFGVSDSNICLIVKRRTWRWLE